MNTICRISGALSAIVLVFGALAPEAQAFRGRGAAFAVGAAVGSSKSSTTQSSTAAAEQTAAAQQQTAAAQQQTAAAQQQTAAAQQEAAAARQQAAAGPLPKGTVVTSLPAGCTSAPSGGVAYYNCGGNTYQAVFEGSNLKYVTTK